MAASVLAQDELCTAAAAHLRTDGRRCVLIEGATATGKSVLADRVAAALRATHSVRIARGDRLERHVDEHALQVASAHPLRRDVADYVADAAEDLGDLLADDGIPFGKIAHRALKQVLAGGAGRRRLSETQQRFLARVLTVMVGKRPLLVADDLHYWDPVSLRLLRRIVRGELDPSFGRLRRLSLVLIVDRRRAEPVNLPLIDAILEAADPLRIELAYAPAEQYGEVLRALGLAAVLPEPELRTLHLLTGGNLALSRLVVDELQDAPASAAERAGRSELAFFQEILARRLDASGAAESARDLIGLLAASGDALQVDELACALRCSVESARARAVAAAEALAFISVSQDRLRLAHETLQPIVSGLLGDAGRDAHQLLATCLSKLRPGDYGRRATHLAAAGAQDLARQLRVMERLGGVREGRYAWTPPRARIPRRPTRSIERRRRSTRPSRRSGPATAPGPSPTSMRWRRQHPPLWAGRSRSSGRIS